MSPKERLANKPLPKGLSERGEVRDWRYRKEQTRERLAVKRIQMLRIAKPFLLDGCGDPLDETAYSTLLQRIDKKEDERGIVGNIILDLMIATQEDTLAWVKEQAEKFDIDEFCMKEHDCQEDGKGCVMVFHVKVWQDFVREMLE